MIVSIDQRYFRSVDLQKLLIATYLIGHEIHKNLDLSGYYVLGLMVSALEPGVKPVVPNLEICLMTLNEAGSLHQKDDATTIEIMERYPGSFVQAAEEGCFHHKSKILKSEILTKENVSEKVIAHFRAWMLSR